MALSALLKEEQKNLLLDKLEGLYNDPKHGKAVKEAMSEFFKVPIPELELERSVDAKHAEVRKEVDDLRGELDERKMKDKIKEEQEALISNGVVTKEELPEVSKLMVEKGIGDYATAADYYRLSKKAAIPTTQLERTRLSLPEEKGLFQDRNAWAKNEAFKAVAEIERNRRAA